MKNKKSITILMVAFTLASCQSYKRVPYLQSYESLTDKGYKEIVINEVNQQDTLYDARIQPKDLLSITVNTSDPQAAAPFNLTMQTSINVAQANSTYVTSQPTLQQYLVNNEGEIDFPVIGKLKIGGLTKTAAEKLVREQLRPYLKETPIVTTRSLNIFKCICLVNIRVNLVCLNRILDIKHYLKKWTFHTMVIEYTLKYTYNKHCYSCIPQIILIFISFHSVLISSHFLFIIINIVIVLGLLYLLYNFGCFFTILI